jgi:UDP-glucose 6-dehydrogenase
MEELFKLLEELYGNDPVAEFKKNLDELDDDIFLKVAEELSEKKVDLHLLDKVLEKEKRTESEDLYLEYMMTLINTIVRKHLKNRISELTRMLDKF